MSNSRRLRIREFTPPPSVTLDAVEDPGGGEACQFHPDCCDPDDFTCPGCGEPAIIVVVYRVNGAGQRMPFCAQHAPYTEVWAHWAQRQAGEAN